MVEAIKSADEWENVVQQLHRAFGIEDLMKEISKGTGSDAQFLAFPDALSSQVRQAAHHTEFL